MVSHRYAIPLQIRRVTTVPQFAHICHDIIFQPLFDVKHHYIVQYYISMNNERLSICDDDR